MQEDVKLGAAPQHGPGSPAAAEHGSLLDGLDSLWLELRGILHDHAQLLALETQRAGESLVAMLAYSVAAVVLLSSAWIGVCGALMLLALETGVGPGGALLAVAVVNLGGVYALWLAILRRRRHLGFPATLGALLRPGAALRSTAPHP